MLDINKIINIIDKDLTISQRLAIIQPHYTSRRIDEDHPELLPEPWDYCPYSGTYNCRRPYFHTGDECVNCEFLIDK